MTRTLDPLTATRRLAASYRNYLTTTYSPRRPDLARSFEDALDSQFLLEKGPFLQASPPFETGASVRELIDEEVLTPGIRRLEPNGFPIGRSLYLHQEQAIRKAVGGARNLVVATGTGSGKTECFLLPIVDHLLREKEQGTLDQPGVRALLLYPMNALANDQVKRLRSLLVDLPEITFGRYVGETEHDAQAAEADFANRYPSEPRLRNELISRQAMQETPPHILLTNYAMLEYLLLRPADSALFDGPTGEHWRFVVLDEVHVYDGAQGTEVAMLLRRVRDRVVTSARGRLQCFATSATLGNGRDDFPALRDFAEDLFDESFEWDDDDEDRQDIVEATRRPLVQSKGHYRLSASDYRVLRDAFRAGRSASELAALIQADTTGTPPAESADQPEAFLYELLRHDENVVELQDRLVRGSVSVEDATNVLVDGDATAADLVALIELCVAARPSSDDAPLIPARYHFFLRSLENAFLCLHDRHPDDAPRIELARHDLCPWCAKAGHEARMFELGICKQCRAEYLIGVLSPNEAGGVTLEAAPSFTVGKRYVLLDEALDADDEDEAATGIEANRAVDRRALCPGCGSVTDLGSTCGCGSGAALHAITVVQPPDTAKGVLHTCAACSARSKGDIVLQFVTGTDAPVAVIATDLYQEIPPSIEGRFVDRVGEGRKLLTFSDSRQDAAFFAPFLETTYQRAVRRRLLRDAIVKLAAADTPRTDDVLDRARRDAVDALVIDPEESRLRQEAEVGSWLALELLAIDRRNSIEGTGTADISLALPRRYQPPPALLRLGFSEQEGVDLVRMLTETLRMAGAVTMPEGVDVKDERFAPRNREFGVRQHSAAPGVVAWCAADSAVNRRLEILDKVFARKHIDADPRVVLDGLWRHLTDEDVWGQTIQRSNDRKHGVLWRLNWRRFDWTPASEQHRPLRCDRCARVWWRTVADICPAWRCTGTVHPVDDLDELGRNHYARLYRELAPIGIAVQEHTAQWSSSRASRIQDDFVNGRVNVLSCSTTFELGVDVGEVQSVLLRNVPPSPANYVQRAGRAGRRTDSAALVVTFAQRRSHDLTHFDDPSRMVDGTVDPPRILLDNPTIVRRHVHSVAFAAFEREHTASAEQHANVEDFFINTDAGATGDAAFVSWLRARPQPLQEALDRLLPEPTKPSIDVDGWGWVDALTEPNDDDPTHGWLERAASGARGEIERLDELFQEAKAADDGRAMERYKRARRTLAARHLLGFLASRNVLPKYGFPVDVVELDVRGSGDADAHDLDLARDLSIAISEYAPGSRIVAAKAVWESTGLVMRPGHHWPTYHWAICDDCGRYRQTLMELTSCPSCGSDRRQPGKTGTFVIPVFGFTGKRLDKVGDTRPPKLWTTESFFGSYRDDEPELATISELSDTVLVEARTSRQGRINLVNRGPSGRGFRICERCGYGEPAPLGGTKKKGPAKHSFNRRPNRECSGALQHRHLGHEYLTDVTEIRLSHPLDGNEAWSVLYALLEGAGSIGIARDDIDGSLYFHTPKEPPAFVLFDAVPGGAGHAQRIAERLPELFRAALARVATCSCGDETSCYSCLRSYSNQLRHEDLSRGAARDILELVLGATSVSAPDGSDDLDLLDDSVRPLVRHAIEQGASVPVAGWPVPSDDGWQVEAAWPDQRVAITVDDDPERDKWLTSRDWDVRHATVWTVQDLVSRLLPDRS